MKKRDKKLQLSRETIWDLDSKKVNPALLKNAKGGGEELHCINPPSSHFPHYCPAEEA